MWSSIVFRSTQQLPNWAARQNTRSSCRIWASWEKLHWLISWLGNLNERLASWKKCKIYARSGWINRYIFYSWQSHCNFFSWILEWVKQVSARENHPTRTVETDTCVLSVIVCKSFHGFDWSWSCKTISFWVKAIEFIFAVGFLTKIALKCLWMILDFGKLKNSCISCSCIFRKSNASHIILCNSVHHF